ncbi:hypothetical protein DFJ73DRAFT_963250 [Zopfochytrium polystomum]|nr:hypothetical protein DFJ73DRAFT_963250 [Zopfochytrium polystomum]
MLAQMHRRAAAATAPPLDQHHDHQQQQQRALDTPERLRADFHSAVYHIVALAIHSFPSPHHSHDCPLWRAFKPRNDSDPDPETHPSPPQFAQAPSALADTRRFIATVVARTSTSLYALMLALYYFGRLQSRVVATGAGGGSCWVGCPSPAFSLAPHPTPPPTPLNGFPYSSAYAHSGCDPQTLMQQQQQLQPKQRPSSSQPTSSALPYSNLHQPRSPPSFPLSHHHRLSHPPSPPPHTSPSSQPYASPQNTSTTVHHPHPPASSRPSLPSPPPPPSTASHRPPATALATAERAVLCWLTHALHVDAGGFRAFCAGTAGRAMAAAGVRGRMEGLKGAFGAWWEERAGGGGRGGGGEGGAGKKRRREEEEGGGWTVAAAEGGTSKTRRVC